MGVVTLGGTVMSTLDKRIWQFLRQAIRVPRDVWSISQAIRLSPSWPPTTIVVSSGTYSETIHIDKPVVLVGEHLPVIIFSEPVPMVTIDCGNEESQSAPHLSGFKLEGGSSAIHITRG